MYSTADLLSGGFCNFKVIGQFFLSNIDIWLDFLDGLINKHIYEQILYRFVSRFEK